MAKIKNMKELRDKVLQAFDDLESGEIDVAQALTMSKLSDAVIAGLKSEMQYAILTNQQPSIPFYGEGSGITLQEDRIKKIL